MSLESFYSSDLGLYTRVMDSQTGGRLFELHRILFSLLSKIQKLQNCSVEGTIFDETFDEICFLE